MTADSTTHAYFNLLVSFLLGKDLLLPSMVQAHFLKKGEGYTTLMELADFISLFQFTFKKIEKSGKIMNPLQYKFYESVQIFDYSFSQSNLY